MSVTIVIDTNYQETHIKVDIIAGPGVHAWISSIIHNITDFCECHNPWSLALNHRGAIIPFTGLISK